jgi:hypothetical protein
MGTAREEILDVPIQVLLRRPSTLAGKSSIPAIVVRDLGPADGCQSYGGCDSNVVLTWNCLSSSFSSSSSERRSLMNVSKSSIFARLVSEDLGISAVPSSSNVPLTCLLDDLGRLCSTLLVHFRSCDLLEKGQTVGVFLVRQMCDLVE